MKAVILAGGTGTRLWPLSRREKPKQFQKLTSDKTMFQETIERLDFLEKKDIYIATNESFAKEVMKEAPEIPKKNIIIEPALRDTAPCIGLAATYIAKDHPDEVMAVIYADHLIKNKAKFIKNLKIAEKIAKEDDTLNIIEVKAKYPNTNLGYVKIGKMIKTVDGSDIYSFEKFTEKPDLATAKKFLESYKYLWNTGLYVWKVSTILDQYKYHQSKMYYNLMKIQLTIGTEKEKKVLKNHYSKCDKISIDYAIMEKVEKSKVRIIPADFGWNDIGTWESLHDELTKSSKENIKKGENLLIDVEGSLVYGPKDKLIATIGLKDVIVVDTKDALLICKKNKSQDVKKIVEKLKENKKDNLY